MNIFLHYIKTHIKGFFIWMIANTLLVVASITKYEGLKGATTQELTKLIDQFPKLFLAMFGMVGLRVEKITDYYAIIGFLVLLVISLYAIRLGCGASTDEFIDHTTEFLYTKPRTRMEILTKKVLAGLLLLVLFAVFSTIIGFFSVKIIAPTSSINILLLKYMAVFLLVGGVYFSISFFLGTILKNPENAQTLANILFLVTFCVGITYDLIEKACFLRWFTPLRYFPGPHLVSGRLSFVFLAVSLVIIILGIFLGMISFNKKNIAI